MVKAVIEHGQMMNQKVPASSEREVSVKLMNKAFVSILNGPIWVHPWAAGLIILFLWGRSLYAYILAAPILSDSEFIT